MPELREERHQHAPNRSESIAHLRALGLTLGRRAALGIAIEAVIKGVARAMGSAIFLHRVHSNVPRIISDCVLNI